MARIVEPLPAGIAPGRLVLRAYLRGDLIVDHYVPGEVVEVFDRVPGMRVPGLQSMVLIDVENYRLTYPDWFAAGDKVDLYVYDGTGGEGAYLGAIHYSPSDED